MPKTDYERHQELLARQLGGLPAPGATPTVEEMRLASGLDDEPLLSELLALGLAPDTLMLMSMAPLVAVAWADGEVQDGELVAIMQAAQTRGIVRGTSAYAMLNRWLKQPPGEALLETWEAFVRAITTSWTEDKAARFREQLGELARAVARASGGVLGLGAISRDEQAIIQRIEDAFDLAAR